MNIDVFFCSVVIDDEKREMMADLCLAQWLEVEGASVYGINNELLDCSPLGFQRVRRVWADQQAASEVYVVADDDCLLAPDFNLKECVRIFKESRFATLSLMPSNCTINEWTPADYATENTADVMEHHSAGHVRFCRKGHLKEWPPMGQGPGYDAIHAEAIRARGGRVGYFRNMKSLHLGEGRSQIWTRELVH